jgi:cobyric acid synthase
LADALRRRKGLPGNAEAFDHARYKESQYDELARIVREALDMKKLYEILDAGCGQ